MYNILNIIAINHIRNIYILKNILVYAIKLLRKMHHIWLGKITYLIHLNLQKYFTIVK